MVQVSVTAKVTVAGGPALPLGFELSPDSYMVAEAILGPQGEAGDTGEIAIVPDPVSLTLLAISAIEATAGANSPVRVVPLRDAASGDPFTFEGTFLLANADILGRLVADGPRAFRVSNEGTAAAKVRLLAAFTNV